MSNVVPIRRKAGSGFEELLNAPKDGSHLVHFYEDERVFCEVTGRFVRAGLEARERVLLVATPEHARGIAPHVAGIGMDRAVASGKLLLLDARETLERFLVDGMPDPVRFHAVLVEALDRLTGGDPTVPVRAFGEMVDVLWRYGRRRAALQLENLWNDAGRQRPFALLCGYAMTNFYDGDDREGERFTDVCNVHTHVLPPESFAQIERSGEPLVEISRLSGAARLAEAERRFRLLVASVRDYAVFMLDPSGVVATWNAGAERIKGWSADEIVGQHFSAFYASEDVAAGKCERALATAAAEGRFEAEGWRVRKDGSRFWANVVITALRESGRLVGFAKVTRDLTDRVRATEERLAELAAQVAAAESLIGQIRARQGHEGQGEAETAMLQALLGRMAETVRGMWHFATRKS